MPSPSGKDGGYITVSSSKKYFEEGHCRKATYCLCFLPCLTPFPLVVYQVVMGDYYYFFNNFSFWKNLLCDPVRTIGIWGWIAHFVDSFLDLPMRITCIVRYVRSISVIGCFTSFFCSPISAFANEQSNSKICSFEGLRSKGLNLKKYQNFTSLVPSRQCTPEALTSKPTPVREDLQLDFYLPFALGILNKTYFIQ